MIRVETKKKVVGKFPQFCYRAFKCKKYAEDFVNSGTFRMGCILSYKEIEDKSRRDATEGKGHTKEPGIVTAAWVSSNPAKTIWIKEQGYKERITGAPNGTFCFCTCLPEANLDYMKNRFSKHIVKIDNPRRLAEDIYDYFIAKEKTFLIVGCEVVYNKGQKKERKLTNNEIQDLSYKQKPECFRPDCEFRIVAIRLNEPCNHECKYLDGQVEPDCKFIEVNLGKQLNYLSLVS